MIEEIKSRIDIVDYVGKYTQLKRSGAKFKCPCPFPTHHDSTPSFYVDPATQKWRCFGACATGGDVIDFVERMHNLTRKDAIEKLAGELGIEIKANAPKASDKLYAVLNAACGLYQENIQVEGNPALAHLRGRGLEAAIDSDFKLGYAGQGIAKKLRDMGYSEKDLLDAGILMRGEHGLMEMFRGRLIIPLFDERGRIVGFAARTLTGEKNKFINTPKTVLFNRSHILYGFAQAKQTIRAQRTAVVVEGYFDVITANLHGKKNVVAQMGTELTEHQAKLLGSDRVIVALDGDEAGVSATQVSLRQSLKFTKNLLIMSLPAGDDPDDVILRGEWDDRLAQAVSALDYLISLEPVPKTFPEREASARRMLELVDTDNPLEAQYAAQKIALAFGLPELSLFEAVKQPVVYERQKTNAEEGLLELTCVNAYLHHYAYINRVFRSLEIPVPNAGDFPVHGSIFSTLLASIEQYDLDPADFVRQYHPQFQLSEDNIAADALLAMFLTLRMQAIESAFTDSTDKIALMTQKARILAYTHP
jgi:DNA primase